MFITYELNGRFGNNLFQYLATKILQHILSLNNIIYTYEFRKPKNDCFIINDQNYIDYITNIDTFISKCNSKNIYLEGYFQFDKHIRIYKEYINSILTINNNERINTKYLIKDIISHINNTNYNFDNSTLVIHIRLDDFLFEKVCMKVQSYISILDTIFNDQQNIFNKVIIIIDKCKYQFEIEYINQLIQYFYSKNIQIDIQSDDLLSDFSKLYYAPYFLSSNSTFSYLAGLLGNHKKTWCPINPRYSHQDINKFDDNTTSFTIEYM